jgi:guanosine-3',5'-bis(diphosphate) 3'-pyrophosphohydrolase
MNNLKLLLSAASFAARRHTGQTRKGKEGRPYINHPIELAEMLINTADVQDVEVLAAALLHDTVEDTETRNEEIAELFGDRVAGIVREVTDDKSLPKHRRKELQIEHAPHLSPDAKLVKIADKISNVTDITNDPPADWPIERRREYIEWGEKVVAGMRGTNSALEAQFDRAVTAARERFF